MNWRRLLIGLLLLVLIVSPVSLVGLDLGRIGRDRILDYYPRDLNFTYNEILAYYRAMARRWYDISTYRLFMARNDAGYPLSFVFMDYVALKNVTITVHEVDIIGGVVYMYPPRGITMYEAEGYSNVFVFYYPNEEPWKLNIPWAVNFMYDYIGFMPKTTEVWYVWGRDAFELLQEGADFYTILAPDYYLLEYDYKCGVYEFPEYHHDYIFFDGHVDPMRFLCYAPPELNITPKVLVVPELYEELRSKHGVYPIYIWINDKIRYVGILAGIETTIGGAIRPDIHNLIRKYAGLNLTRDYVVFVVVVPMFANKGLYQMHQDNVPDFHVVCSRRGCLYTGFAIDVLNDPFLHFEYSLDKPTFEALVNKDIRGRVGNSVPVYFDIRILNVPLKPVYVYEPRIVIPEGVYHTKPNYTYILFPEFVRDLRAGNLTLPPPNTERVFLNETDIPEEFPDETGGSTPTPTTTTVPASPTAPTVPTATLTETAIQPAPSPTQTTGVSTPEPDIKTSPAPVTITVSTTVVMERPGSIGVSSYLLVFVALIALVSGILIGRYTVRR